MSGRPKNNTNLGERCCRATVLSRANLFTQSVYLDFFFNTAGLQAGCQSVATAGQEIHACNIYQEVSRRASAVTGKMHKHKCCSL